MGGAIHSLEKRGEEREKERRGGKGRGVEGRGEERRGEEKQVSEIGGCLAVKGQGSGCLFFFFNSSVFGTSKYGKIRLISLLIFFSGDIKCKLKAYDRQYDKQETKEPYKNYWKKEEKFKRFFHITKNLWKYTT